MPKAELIFDQVQYGIPSELPGQLDHVVSLSKVNPETGEQAYPDGVDIPNPQFDRLVEIGAVKAFGSKSESASSTGFGALTVAELDQIAVENDVTDYPADGKKAEKVAALEQSGVEPPAASE